MPLLGASQEVAKKDAKTFPLGSPLSVPLCNANRGEKYVFPCRTARHKPTRAAGGESKRSCGFLKGIRPLSPFSWFVLCRMTKNEHKSQYRSARAKGAQYDRQEEKTWKIWFSPHLSSPCHHERQAKTDEMRQSKSNIVERVGGGPRACGSYSVDKGENYPILLLAFFIKFLGIQGGFFQKAPLVAEGAFGPSYLIFCWLHQIFMISL